VITRTGVLAGLPADRVDRLMALAHEVSYPMGSRIFEEDGRADRFWIIRAGSVALDLHAPGSRPAVVETVGAGELLGWSWLCPPYRWHLGAQANSAVSAWEFDAAAVRALCTEDTVLGQALTTVVAGAIGQRLRAARTRLLDLYGSYGSGPER
jgi:CRP-like cAMP-binding protein